MTKRKVIFLCTTAALGISLAALPAISSQKKPAQDSSVAALKREISELKAKLAAAQRGEQESAKVFVDAEPQFAVAAEPVEIDQEVFNIQEPEVPEAPGVRSFVMSLDGNTGSWLGVEIQEVSAEKAKELKLSNERGALIEKVLPDSPAAKAGLKENDIVTEINGQRVEGTMQFRRMIREIPSGRAVQFSLWRDGKQQSITATLGKSDEGRSIMRKAMPQTFSFRMPEMPEIPEMRNFDWNGAVLLGGKPRLGIDAEDLSGQLGTFFGAPDGEGILVRSVNGDSPAEKGGVKAGDVITTFNGDRIHTSAELREKLANSESGKPVTLGIVRNKSNITVTVELPTPAPKQKKTVSHRTNI